MKKAILSILADCGKMPVGQLADALGYSMPTSSLRAAIKDLAEEQKIEYTEKNLRAPNPKIKLKVN